MSQKSVAELIREEIRQQGPISFARFMEMALYTPVVGYYERRTDQIGKRGDFYTSVSVGSLFGELLAAQFSDWFQELASYSDSRPPTSRPLQIVEAGAHDGRLAADILAWFREERPQLFDSLEYCLVEDSAARRRVQEATLRDFAAKVRWISSWDAVEPQSIRGVIFCNELLDAMPVHRFGWDKARGEWFEWGVALEETDFRWTKLSPSSRPEFPGPLLSALPDQFIAEQSPAAESWWREAAARLARGWLLAIDYGEAAAVRPERLNGTLRAYRNHHQSAEILADPGDQDLTAHVNFGALRALGEQAGLRTTGLCSQAEFLTRVALRQGLKENGVPPWPATKVRQFQTLVHPEFLGRAFQVLVQERLQLDRGIT